jgi:hypothetical protein
MATPRANVSRTRASERSNSLGFEHHIFFCRPRCGEKSSADLKRGLRKQFITSLNTVMAFELGTPVNTALLLYILYSVQRTLLPSPSLPSKVPNEFKSGYSWMPKSHPPVVLYKTYTPKTLEPFHGRDGGRILLAINGLVFDVTDGRSFYGPSVFHCISHSPPNLKGSSHRWHVWKLCRPRCFQRHGQTVL